ncbi:MAG: glycoside hydrolase family 44 protein, partial [Opitutaceae bacterium]
MRADWFQKIWTEHRSRWALRVSQDHGAVVFLGDSITEGWGDDFGGSFPGLKAVNRGIGGDTTRGVLLRLQEDVLALHPAAVVLLIGINDIGCHAAPETIAGNLKLILAAFKRADPHMPVILCQVFPSSATKKGPASQIEKLNELYAAAIKGDPQVTLLETWPLFANAQGEARPEEFPDLVHPNAAGYAKWAAALRPALVATLFPAGEHPAVLLTVDAAADRQPIPAEIYGVSDALAADPRIFEAFGGVDDPSQVSAITMAAELPELNVPLNRHGGNFTTRYNWELNASSYDRDWFFESLAEPGAKPGAIVDAVIEINRAAGAATMVTIPINGWVAKLGPGRTPLWGCSIKKYGAQEKNDASGYPDAGNGVRTSDGAFITDNDPNDANQPATPEFQRGWIQHLVQRWGRAADGGVRYYLMDNEPSIWWANHRDVIKTGTSAAELCDDIAAYATMIRKVDPTALICGPEEWGWNAFFYSGQDQQWGDTQKKLTGSFPGRTAPFPDRAACGGMDYMPWLLHQLYAREQATGVRLLDVFTFHFYPSVGEFSDDVSPEMQLKRNRSTRILWDPNYRDPSWINDVVRLIPRMRELVATYYPGRAIGITEYNWGGGKHINAATAQADILGIFGREGLNLAARWTTPSADSPVFKAFQMYRNYDGQRSTFGDTRVQLTNSANVDDLSAFAAERSGDGALTIMIVAKDLSGTTPVELKLNHFAAGARAQVWQLTAANRIDRLADLSLSEDRTSLTVPAQSITLLV